MWAPLPCYTQVAPLIGPRSHRISSNVAISGRGWCPQLTAVCFAREIASGTRFGGHTPWDISAQGSYWGRDQTERGPWTGSEKIDVILVCLLPRTDILLYILVVINSAAIGLYLVLIEPSADLDPNPLLVV